MPNRVRPRCTACTAAMLPVFRQRPRGEKMERIPDVFYCPDDHTLARGRRKPRYLEA